MTVNEDVQFSYNITVNITDSGPDANVTRVNITLQSPFNFTAGTNATDVPTFTVFTNTSGVLTWENSTYFVVNGSEIRYFTFNATIATPGNYVITVKTVNITGEYSSNISVTVNDTTIPSSIQFVSPSAANNSNLSQNTIAVNFSATDNGNISMIVIRLYNSTGSQINISTNSSINAISTSFLANFTGLADGTYYINASVNDTAGNINASDTRAVVLDTIAPSSIQFIGQTPANGVNLSQNYIPVNVSATDPNTIGTIAIRLYNSTGSQINITSSSTSPVYINFTGLADGTYYINASVNDTAGNINITGTRTINLDTTAPSLIQFIGQTPINNSIQIASSIAINISATDAMTIGTIVGRLYNSTWSQINITSSSTSPVYINFTGLSAGTYYINASVNDTAGNINISGIRTILLSTQSFKFNGTARDEEGNALNNSVVNITIRNMQGWGVVGYSAGTTNASGWFNFNVPLNGESLQTQMGWIYEPTIIHRNAANGSFVDFRSKVIPAFPFMVVQMLAGTNFYLAPAGTINITAVNDTGQFIPFNYQVKDTKLGYPIAMNFQTPATEVVVYVPRNRNYSIMIYPNQNMPVSFSWNNFSSLNSYNISYNSSYNATTKTLHKRFQITTSLPRVWGYINFSGIMNTSGIISWTNFTVIPYLLEPGNMLHAEYGDLPYNLSSSQQVGRTDVYNLTTGYYNISLPATLESSTIILFAVAQNGTNYYGGFRNISLAYGGADSNINFAQMGGLVGGSSFVDMGRIDGGANINISMNKKTFELANGSGQIIGNLSAHVEVTVDYSSLGAIEFTWMTDIDQSSPVSRFLVPLLNNTGIKELNVYANGGGGAGDSDQYAPKRMTYTSAQIVSNATINITISDFNPRDIDNAVSSGQISMELFISNSTCDVPNPPGEGSGGACSLGGSKTMNTSDANGFNPMQAIMGGGKISFRMGTGNITVHYVNVDLLASGPPDALFDRSTSNTTTSTSFDAAVRFGSGGPTIYDYVLVSIPYTEGSDTVTGLNESADVNMSVPVLYDDSWNVIWNATLNGTNGAALAGNNSHYSTYQNQWQTLMGQNNCTTNVNVLNSTNPCFIDKTNNKIWVRLPHFSGTGPRASGSGITAASTSTTTTTSSGGGGGTGAYWTKTYVVNNKDFSAGYSQQLKVKERLKLKVSDKDHYVGVVELTTSTATINVSSSPQQATLAIGDLRKFDVTDDGYYDLSVKLNSINGTKADITIKSIYEQITPETKAEEQKKEEAAKEEVTEQQAEPQIISEKKPSLTFLWILIGIVVVVIIIVVVYNARKKRR